MNTRLKDSMRCCSVENHRLKDVLRTCDYCTESLEERHLCYSKAARDSGKRAKACIIRH